jgi:hypothetical protein
MEILKSRQRRVFLFPATSSEPIGSPIQLHYSQYDLLYYLWLFLERFPYKIPLVFSGQGQLTSKRIFLRRVKESQRFWIFRIIHYDLARWYPLQCFWIIDNIIVSLSLKYY